MARTSAQLIAQLKHQLTRTRTVRATMRSANIWATVLDILWVTAALLALLSLFVYLSDPTLRVLYWYQLTTPAFWAGNIVLFWPWAALLGLSVLELVRLGIRTFRSHRVAANIQQHPDTVVLAQILRINGRIAMTYSQPNDALPVPQVIANLSDADRVLWKDLTAQRCHHSGASGHQFTGYDDQGIRRFLAARTTLRVYEFINTTNTIPYLWSTSDGDDVAVYYQPQSGPAHLIMARITPKGSIQHSSLRLWLLLTFAEIRSIGEDS
ncbi:hypothetical protein [Lacticaseibacillus thailandensis]|uniref:Uncharacterized protein n=1 Tax=Lacticaseibacillus thailandensis DSM 22698 = JCM 13996 TaxID=1423810 RepID=A0A0R2CIH3_9LACO|nr:hypothetical protein [Lacticaseibacillus thailandensis]KRM87491.1 hypothetical protein FD19_GL000998 [Lacticaseibacillus thailandensis DSM 22698 = JCM 13996]